MNLILLEPREVDPSGTAVLTDRRAHHVLTVLRAVPGQELRVGVIDGPIGRAVMVRHDPGGVTLQCTFDAATPGRPRVDLLLALPRPKVLRRLWAQVAALGVGRVILTNAERVERHYFDTHLLAPEAVRALLVEGLEQARDTRLPAVTVHRRFRPLVEDELDSLSDADVRLTASPDAGATVAQGLAAPAHRVLLAVGPEGGWNRFELDLLAAHRFREVGMGARTLRSDTATVALLALVHQALGAAAPRPAADTR